MRCAVGLMTKKGEDAPQDLEQQDLEEKLHDVGVCFSSFFCYFLFQARRTNPSLNSEVWEGWGRRRHAAPNYPITLCFELVISTTRGAPVHPGPGATTMGWSGRGDAPLILHGEGEPMGIPTNLSSLKYITCIMKKKKPKQGVADTGPRLCG